MLSFRYREMILATTVIFFGILRDIPVIMANPIYADLPGIDQSENIEKPDVSAKQAYTKFQGKSLDASTVDFTDSIKKQSRTGYDVMSGDRDMEDVQKQEKSELLSPVVLAKQVGVLQQQPVQLSLTQTLGSEVIANLEDPQGSLQKRLLTQQFKQSTSDSSRQKSKGAKKGDPTSPAALESVTYKLFYEPEHSRSKEKSRIADLERRLKMVEQIMGHVWTSVDLLSLKTISIHKKNIQAILDKVSERLNKILDFSILDKIEGEIVSVIQPLLLESEKKSSLEEMDSKLASKVEELYHLAHKADIKITPMHVVIAVNDMKMISGTDYMTMETILFYEKILKEALDDLAERLNKIMDLSNIEIIEGRIVRVTKLLKLASEKKSSLEEMDSKLASKVEELYHLAHKADTMSATLPSVVDRMVAPQQLHEQDSRIVRKEQ